MLIRKSLAILYSAMLAFTFVSCTKKDDLLNEVERKWLIDHPDLIAAINPTYAPYQYINEQGELDGIFVGFIKLIEERIGYTFKKKIYFKWNNVLLDAKDKKIDVILEIQETTDRNKYLTFSNPLVSQPHVIVTQNSIKKNINLSYLNGKKVGVIRGYSIEEYLSKNYPEYILVKVANDQEAYQKMKNGELDAVISFRAIANYFINQKGHKNLVINRQIPYLNQSSIANLREHYILSNIFDKAIRNISNKEKKEIFDNWSYSLVKPVYLKPWFWLSILGFLLGLVVLNAFINKLLKTKVREKTVELRIAKEKAEESSRLKTTFLHNISHEIRTPVNAVVGFSDMIEKGIIKKEEHPKFLKVIKHSGEQLINVIDDILEISSLDTKKAKIRNANTNVSEIIQELCAIYEVQTLQKNIKLHLNGAKDIWAITDRSKLRKIFSSLIDNAVKNTETGSIHINYKIVSDKLYFSIADTGKGIPKELLPTIFERFQKSSNRIRDYDEGVGLGLSLTKENIELLEGNIKVHSIVNEGTYFDIEIPVILGTSEQYIDVCNATSSLNIKQVLIAEDGKINFIVLKRLLKKLLGATVEILHAENGVEAFASVNQNSQLDLVLMDIKMPLMDGYEATAKIKGKYPNIPIIAQTAYADPDDQQIALDAGRIDVITKPIKIEDLKISIEKLFLKTDSQSQN